MARRRKNLKPKTTTMWIVYNPKGEPILASLSNNQMNSWDLFDEYKKHKAEELRKKGYHLGTICVVVGGYNIIPEELRK